MKGIATTMMATLGCAAAGGRRRPQSDRHARIHVLLASGQDRRACAQDATYRAKRDFIDRHDLVVFHFHDHWHRRKPDGIALGMAREVGWDRHLIANTEREFEFADRTLVQLARELQARLHVRTMRVVGDPAMKVTRALASWGFVSLTPGVPYIARDDVDALVVGETREWELVEYVAGPDRLGPAEGADHDRACAVGTGRHEILRRLAPLLRHGGAD